MVAEPLPHKPWTLFLSHCSQDKGFTDWLYDKLRSANLEVWYDRYEILVGDSIPGKIAEGLNGSEFLIVVVSPQAVRSNWVQAEFEPFLVQQILDQQITILPIVLGDVPLAEFPPLLRGKKSINFPPGGSDEQFRTLLEDIAGHLDRRGLLTERHWPIMPAPLSMPPNPFGLRGGVEPERFVVPERLAREITEDIAKKQSVSIIGALMMGKTSWLKFLASELCRSRYQDENGQRLPLQFVSVNLQEHSAMGRDQLLPTLASAASALLPQEQRFQGATHSEALDWIKHMTGQSRRGSPCWVFLVDEFDLIVELDGIDVSLLNDLRSLPQSYNLCYIMASRRKLIDLPLPQSVNASPFFNFCTERFLSVWDEPTARALMFQPQGREVQFFSEDDVAFVTRLTARQPLLLQLVQRFVNSYKVMVAYVGLAF